jgi:putative (di)nucleoside polyphosphate hydrolase
MSAGAGPKPYRPNVGVAIFSRAGLVFAGMSRSAGPERVWPGFEWQMPQGGLDPGEELVAAARREAFEETGMTSLVWLATTPDWLSYDFPAYEGPPHKLCAFRGQTQRWVAFRFEGDEREIDVSKPNGDEPAEFTRWAWMGLDELTRRVVPFKRPTYERVARAFAPFRQPA